MSIPISHCTTCDGHMLKNLISAGTSWLERHYQEVNTLNVFPVPDGDTGTNMLLTLRNAHQSIASDDAQSAKVVADRMKQGALMGARGNSGTILSQIFAGFASALEGDEFDIQTAAAGLQSASDFAYRAVQKPAEGTLLTVIREIAEEAQTIQSDNLVTLMEKIVERGWSSVRHTPELLPILKQANVVDAGGMGLVYFLEGMLKFLHGERLRWTDSLTPVSPAEVELSAFEGEVFNYDVQFLIHGRDLPVETIRRDIEAMGDSGVIVGDPSLVKVHIHVDDPGIPISYGVKYGSLADVVVDYMQAQYEARRKFKQVKPGQIAVIAVAPGDGLAAYFGKHDTAGIVQGGQGSNPSTEEIIAAAHATGTDRVIVLPNNKNIILAAEQAARHSNSVEIAVVPTTSPPQGIAALAEYEPEGELNDIAKKMAAAYDHVITGEVTRASRSAHLNGLDIEIGQFIGLIDNDLRAAGDDITQTILALLAEVDLDEAEYLTLYHGEDVPRQDGEALVSTLQAAFPHLGIELVNGGQPHYFYILGIE